MQVILQTAKIVASVFQSDYNQTILCCYVVIMVEARQIDNMWHMSLSVA